jgi:predicted PurR-regulated permease PerM
VVQLFRKIKIGKFQVPRGLGAVFTIILFYSVILAFVALFIPLVAEEARIISSMEKEQVASSLEEHWEGVEKFIDKYRTQEPESSETTQEYVQKQLKSLIDGNSVMNILGSTFSFLGNIFVALFSVTFILFFFLKDEKLFYSILMALTPDRYLPKVKAILSNSKHLLTRYLYGMLIQVTLVSILIALGLSVLGVKYAFLIAFFAGIMNIVPYVGPLIGMLFGILVAVTTGTDMDLYQEIIPLIIKVVVIFQAVQILDNMVFQPYIFSNSISAHPLEIFFVVLVAGTFAGIPGMILAIPLYTVLRIIGKECFFEFKIVKKLTDKI